MWCWNLRSIPSYGGIHTKSNPKIAFGVSTNRNFNRVQASMQQVLFDTTERTHDYVCQKEPHVVGGLFEPSETEKQTQKTVTSKQKF